MLVVTSYNFSHKRIPSINPYMANASANATMRKFRKNSSGFSAAALIAADPEAASAIPAARHDNPTASDAPKAISPLSSIVDAPLSP